MRCPTCRETELSVFFEADGMPLLCNQLAQSPDAARDADCGDIRLGFCDSCAMIFNVAFDPRRIVYDESYENSLHFSERFQRYAEDLARGLVERYGLRGAQVVEIGCGKGDFLRLLCSLGDNRGIGVDASFEGDDAGGAIEVIREPFSEIHRDLQGELVCCRHVLEHIPDPLPFLAQVRAVAASRGDGPVFFEVPNSLYTLRDLGIWDVIYEHCSYFTAPSLARLFGEAGFSVAETGETYGGQFLTLHGTAGEPGQARASGAEIAAIADRVGAFAGHQRSKVAEWNERLAAWLAEGRKPAIWGAGSKGVTFLNTLELGSRVVCAIDINERKHGRFVPGSGQEVVPPERAVELGADVVLIMNPLYRDEIRQQLASLGVAPEIAVV